MYFSLDIKTPGPYKNKFKNLFFVHKQLAKFKSIEFETFKNSDTLLKLELDIRFKYRDHAGHTLELTIFGIGFSLRFYDHRHWDYKNNTWEN